MQRPAPQYSEYEKRFILSNYQQHGGMYCARHLNRSRQSVFSKALEMGLVKKKPQKPADAKPKAEPIAKPKPGVVCDYLLFEAIEQSVMHLSLRSGMTVYLIANLRFEPGFVITTSKEVVDEYPANLVGSWNGAVNQDEVVNALRRHAAEKV